MPTAIPRDLGGRSGKGDINAAVATRNAPAKRKLVEQINAEADSIEEPITDLSAMEEKGYWLCEDGHEMEHQPPSKPTDEKFNGITIAAPTCECGKRAKLVRRSEMSGQEKDESDQERKEAER
jgi:hypothetical protein